MKRTLSTECVCYILTQKDGTERVEVFSPRWNEIELNLKNKEYGVGCGNK